MNQPEFLCDSKVKNQHLYFSVPLGESSTSSFILGHDTSIEKINLWCVLEGALLHWCDFCFERVFKNHWFPTGKLVHLSFWCKELLQNASGFFTCKSERGPPWRSDVSNTTKKVIRGGKIKPDITASLMFHLPRWSLIVPNLRSISMHSIHGPFWTCEFPYLKMKMFQNCPMFVYPSGFVLFQPIFELWRSKSGSWSAPSAQIPWWNLHF